MGDRRRLVHKKDTRKGAEILREKREKKSAAAQKKVAITMGKAYTLEQIQTLIASLTSESVPREIQAVAEFAENQGAVSEAAASIPDVSGTEIMELVIAAVLKNQTEMLNSFEKQRKTKALEFIAKSSSIPTQVQKKAEIILQKIEPQVLEAPKKKEEVSLIAVPYTIQEVTALVKNLESDVVKIKVAAAIKFIKDYPRITPTVAEAPMLTVTSVTTKAVEVIKENTEMVVNTMVEKKMVPALVFLASLSQVPMPIRKQAHAAAEKLKAEAPSPLFSIKVPEKEADSKQPEYGRSKEYAPMELEALLSGLDSVERVRAVRAAVEFLINYQIISEFIAKTPMLTVTEVTTKAVKVIEGNLGAVLKELKKAKDIHALEFLAHSSKFSDKTRKKASAVLKLLVKPFDDKQ